MWYDTFAVVRHEMQYTPLREVGYLTFWRSDSRFCKTWFGKLAPEAFDVAEEVEEADDFFPDFRNFAGDYETQDFH